MNDSGHNCLTSAEIDLILHGTLRPNLARRVKDHLEACAPCRAALDDQRQLGEFCRRPSGQAGEPPALDGYIVQRWLGRGGCGDVWLSYYRPLAQDRALKILRLGRFSSEGLEQVRQEARLMAALKPHRNRVPIYDLIEREDMAVLAMAYVAGGTLTRLPPLRWERAVRFIADAADGLVEMHAHGMLHRDIKPDNLLWDRERDTVLVSDFGLAAHLDQQREHGWTLGYAAPEVLRGRAEPRSDVFSLTATLFFLLLGAPPFCSDDRDTSLASAAHGLPPLPQLEWFPRPLVDLLCAGLAPAAADRPQLHEFERRLRNLPQEVLVSKPR